MPWSLVQIPGPESCVWRSDIAVSVGVYPRRVGSVIRHGMRPDPIWSYCQYIGFGRMLYISPDEWLVAGCWVLHIYDDERYVVALVVVHGRQALGQFVPRGCG